MVLTCPLAGDDHIDGYLLQFATVWHAPVAMVH